MDNKLFETWCGKATDQIRYPPDRRQVYSELMAHLEDHRDVLIEQGLTERQATHNALEAMGSAKEIAPQLAAIHRPFWGYFYSVVKVAAIILCTFTLLLLILSLAPTLNYYLHYHDDAMYLSPNQLENWQVVTQVKPQQHDYSDGYLFHLPDAVLWEMDGEYVLAARLQVIDLGIFTRNFSIFTQLWAVDSAGNRYPCRADSDFNNETGVTTGGGTGTGCLSSSTILVKGLPSADITWLELRYDRDGRDIVFYIDLAGGGDS